MKFTLATATLSLLAVGTSATTAHAARDLETLQGVFPAVLDQMSRVTAAIDGFSNPGDIPALTGEGKTMISTLQSSDAEILAMTPVTPEEAASFVPLSDRLDAAGATLLGALQAKTPVFQKAGFCPQLLPVITTMSENVLKLMTDVLDKFPTEGRETAQAHTQQFRDMFAVTLDKLQACAAVGETFAAGKGPGPTATGVPFPRVSGGFGNNTDSRRPFIAGASMAGVAKGAVAVALAAYFL